MTNETARIFVHDMRNPLTGIRMQASMLEEGDYGKLSEEGKKAVQQIEEAAGRALAILEQAHLTDEKS